MEYKSITNQVADIDIASRRVKFVGNEMGLIDLDNDIMDVNSFTKSISERGPKGSNSIYWLQDHNPSIGSGLIGKFTELYTEGNKLIAIGIVPRTTIGDNVMKHYEAGNINGHSIGFSAVSVEKAKGNGPRIIKEAKLFEISAVLFPSNPATPTLSVGKSGLALTEEKADWICKQLALLHTEIRSSQHKPDSELVTLWFNQIMDEVKNSRFATQADNVSKEEIKSPVPDNNRLLIESFEKLNGLFIRQDTPAAVEALKKSEEVKRQLQVKLHAANARAGRIAVMNRKQNY